MTKTVNVLRMTCTLALQTTATFSSAETQTRPNYHQFITLNTTD